MTISLMLNDAVEKLHSEKLFQLWADFFQTKLSSSFSVFCFPKLVSVKMRLIQLVHLFNTEKGVGLDPEPGEERAAISLSAGA